MAIEVGCYLKLKCACELIHIHFPVISDTTTRTNKWFRCNRGKSIETMTSVCALWQKKIVWKSFHSLMWRISNGTWIHKSYKRQYYPIWTEMNAIFVLTTYINCDVWQIKSARWLCVHLWTEIEKIEFLISMALARGSRVSRVAALSIALSHTHTRLRFPATNTITECQPYIAHGRDRLRPAIVWERDWWRKSYPDHFYTSNTSVVLNRSTNRTCFTLKSFSFFLRSSQFFLLFWSTINLINEYMSLCVCECTSIEEAPIKNISKIKHFK